MKPHGITLIPMEIFTRGFMYYCYQGSIGCQKGMRMKLIYRWVKLNPIDGTLIEFKSKRDCPNKPYKIIPLHSIQSISLAQKKWYMKKNLYYWEIMQYGKKFIM